MPKEIRRNLKTTSPVKPRITTVESSGLAHLPEDVRKSLFSLRDDVYQLVIEFLEDIERYTPKELAHKRKVLHKMFKSLR
ncbi:MAG: hypothetical protein GWN00_01375 [Aliifodinibius sp.]|nr:hypothetical protein [Fodinibius sp.]NIY23513.1 hypothetical protein [Fodinibius sp.]